MMLNIPAYKYNLKVICIDDNELYLNSLAQELSKTFSVETFNNPILALEYIRNTKSNILSEFLEITPDLESNRVLVDLKIEQIATLSEIEKTEIGVVIVDHHMPEMSGIDFCKQLPDNICKVLLTGAGDSNVAVQYFNNNVIDYYYLKGTSELIDELNEVIETTFKQYFLDKTKHIYTALSTTKFPLVAKPLCTFITETLEQNLADEFYLLDKNGSFMFVTDQKKNYIIVHNDASINEFIENYQDNEQVFSIINQIKDRVAIPTFKNILPEDVAFEEWSNYIAPCQIIRDVENYYVAVIYG